MTGFDVAISLGTREGDAVDPDGIVFQHHLAERARVDAEVLSGGHLLHLAVAGCLFNDILRAASSRDIKVNDLRVQASGGFEGDPLLSTGITYSIEIEGEASEPELQQLVRDAETAAAIPLTLREGVRVEPDELSIRGVASD
ncbi:MAG TPA: OsmC family protein [Solirubrobacterales bacterium]|nr:OsmC family protein [Solirubrobacterales bacterium]